MSVRNTHSILPIHPGLWLTGALLRGTTSSRKELFEFRRFSAASRAVDHRIRGECEGEQHEADQGHFAPFEQTPDDPVEHNRDHEVQEEMAGA